MKSRASLAFSRCGSLVVLTRVYAAEFLCFQESKASVGCQKGTRGPRNQPILARRTVR